MKKFLLFLLGCFFISVHAMAQTPIGSNLPFQILFSVGWIDPTPVGEGPAKGTIDPPTVYLEDYTLTFEADHPEYILYIKDEDDAIVYSTVVSTTVTEVVLPSYLSGDYEIDLVMGDWLFTGWINL